MPRGRLRAAILRVPETSRTLEDLSAGDCNRQRACSLKMYNPKSSPYFYGQFCDVAKVAIIHGKI